jgi:hypothetical protein
MRPNTLRVRLQRQRRREGLRLLTVEMHETAIQAAIARGLLKREESADDWPRLRQLKPLCLPETQNGRQGQGSSSGSVCLREIDQAARVEGGRRAISLRSVGLAGSGVLASVSHLGAKKTIGVGRADHAVAEIGRVAGKTRELA